MKRRSLFALLVFSFLAVPGFSKDTKRYWQTGKLVSITEASPERIGIVTGSQSSVVGTYSECRTWLYAVEGNTISYAFSAHTGAWCANHPNPLTVGAQVKFALDQKSKAFLIDEDGKEFKADVITKTSKNPSKN
jgi:hypothetical protein